MLIQATPVKFPIRFTIKKDKKIKNRPKIAKTKVFLEDSICFSFPPDVINLIPAIIMNIIAKAPDNNKAIEIMFATKGNMQSSVAMPLKEQEPVLMLIIN